MNDETLMADRIHDLVKESRRLEREKEELANRVKKLEIKLGWKKYWHRAAGFTLALGLLVGPGWLCWKGLNSYDTDRCYIERGSSRVDVFEIYRKVEWWFDRELGFSTDLDKAIEIAKRQGCKVPKVED